MSFEDNSETETHELFGLKFKCTAAQQRAIYLEWIKWPEMLEYTTKNVAVKNGRGYALHPDYLALCARLAELDKVLAERLALIIDGALRA